VDPTGRRRVRRRRFGCLESLVFIVVFQTRLSAQVAPGVSPAPAAPAADSALAAQSAREALSEARDAQSRFERLRRQWSPSRPNGWLGTDCDERIGRICLRYDEGGDWWPEAEDPRIVSARGDLLSSLEEAARTLPHDEWLLGQRVLYLVEGGFAQQAEALARTCAEEAPAWCGLLLGYALHVQGRWVQSETAFRSALLAMDEEEQVRWIDPGVLLDRDGQRYLEELEEGGPVSHREGVQRVWRLADPLYLVDGNDRLTEHWSRLTVSRLRDGVVNPYALRWGEDLEEVLVRYGWEVGWDRVLDLTGGVGTGMVGHHHPESRVYPPPGKVLEAPTAATNEDWPLSPSSPPDGYAPAYAPVIVPADGELLRFPRGDRVVVLATFRVPEDTTHHSRHGHPPFSRAQDQVGLPVRAGLFLVPLEAADLHQATTSGATEGALLLEAPAGRYVSSVEVWVPERGFAGRLRGGVSAPPVPLDVATLSDIVLLTRALPDSVPLESAIDAVRGPGPVAPGEELVVGWELHGLGWRRDVLSYRLSLTRTDAGFFGRVGEWLGLSDPEAPLRLTWEEAGPSRPGPSFRSLAVQIPEVERGEYVLRLEVSGSAGPPIATERTLRVTSP
jgi:hypothetical protein